VTTRATAPRGPRAAPLAAPTGTEARAIDARAMSELGVPSAALMERAGTHAAHLVVRRLGLPPTAHAVVLAGGGDNGGDARIVARCLAAWGGGAELLETSPDGRSEVLGRGFVRAEPTGDLSDELLRARLAAADVVVDGMLGAGARGELRGEVLRVAQALEAVRSGGRVRPLLVSLDVPTGLDADDGSVSPHALRADATISFGPPKLGTLLHPGRAHAGRLMAVEIGFPVDAGAGSNDVTWAALDAAWAAGRLPVRDPDTHKNASGAVLVVAGSEGMAGAAILAGRAALRSGAGYLRIASVASNREPIQSGLPEAVWVERGDADALASALEASAGVVVGPGIGTGPAAAEVVRGVLAAGRPTVLDADALSLLAAGEVALPGSATAILTPHPGEAARLLGVETGAVQGDRLGALDRLVERFAPAVVLLKGAPSLVGGSRRRLDPGGSSDLATAGVGDVLAGTIGSLVAQRVDPEDAAALGLWLTSAAARRAAAGPGLQSADLPEYLPGALAGARGGARRPVEPWLLCDLPAAR